jgi:ribosomal protein L39E
MECGQTKAVRGNDDVPAWVSTEGILKNMGRRKCRQETIKAMMCQRKVGAVRRSKNYRGNVAGASRN